jgi:hypothetical protein
MTDLEARLRAAAEHLPSPDDRATDAARTAMHAALEDAPWRGGERRQRPGRWPGSRPLLLTAALGVAVAGGALAASGWSVRDLPPFGHGDRDAFVLPATDVLPGGYERTRPPRYADLPPRPSLLFPAGVDYTKALTAYSATRVAGRVLPRGVVLDDPLPAGKVVMVRDDGRVAIDPAAPFGWSATTGLVVTLPGTFSGQPIAIARCQLLLGANDPNSPPCDAPGPRAYVREGVNGRWIPSPNEEDVADVLPPGSTELSVLTDPDVPTVPLRELQILNPAPPGGPALRPRKARLALDEDGVRLIIVTFDENRLCFLEETAGQGAGSTCGPRSSFLSRGADLTGARYRSGPLRVSGLVGDGIDTVRTDDGRTIPVRNNVFTLSPADTVRRLTFSGPVGTFSLPFNTGAGGPKRFTPDRIREREVVGVHLRDGGHASVRIAPNRGGGRCQWVYVKGDVRSLGCTRPGDQPLSYDVVTGGFIRRINRVSNLFEGEFAPQVRSVEIRYADGDTTRHRPKEGFVMFEVPAKHMHPARRAVSITTYDHHGVALARTSVPYRG